jgi:1,4-dihydroxy-2-naphthoate octaprenyltransferase
VIWFKAARAPFLIVSIIPACLGGAIAYAHESFNGWWFVLATLGVVLAHSAADFLDDYYDFKTGVLGHKEDQFHDSPLISGEVTAGQVLGAGIGCVLGALAIGLFFLLRVGTPVAVLALLGGAIVFFYTAPPLKLNFRGFGETALFLAFGPLLVLGITTVLTGTLDWEPVIAGLPLGLLTMNVGHISNIFDVPSDLESNKMTVAVRLGQAKAVFALGLFSGLAYLSVLVGVVSNILPMWTLVVWITLPLAVNVVRLSSRFDEPDGYTPAMGQAIALTTTVGILMCLAYLASVWL